MTYFQEGWDLFICRFLYLSKTIDHTDKGSFVIDESHLIQIEIFKSDNPESAYNHAVFLLQSMDFAYRNDKGQEVNVKCLGINDLETLQSNIQTLDRRLNDETIGCWTIDSFDIKEFNKEGKNLIRKKEELALFK